MLIFVLLAVIFSLEGFAEALEKKEICPNGQQHYRATIRHIESGGIGYEEGYTTLETFLSPDPSQWKIIPFLDLRGHIFNNGKWATNAGAGLRALRGNRAYGINAYYDYRNAGRLNANQIGIGLETLGELFDFHINGYLPIGAKTSDPYDSIFGTFFGHYMFISQKYQSAMKGAEAEFGFHFGKSKSFDFYAAAGPYYFIGEIAPATWGGKTKISATFKDILTLEISDSYDRTFHNKFQGQISLNFSFGPSSKVKEQNRTCEMANTLNNRMLQPVIRQEIVVIDTPRHNTIALNPVTGLPYFFVFVDNTSHSDGSYESPYHNLVQAQNNSSPNDIIYVFPGDGTTTGMDSGIFLKANQKFWGSGVSHSIQTSEGMISIPAQSSSFPTITNTNIDTEGNAITLATHNAISGFILTGALNDAIYGSDPQSVEISSCTITNTTTYAIEALFSGNASISLMNNQFLNNTNGVFLALNGTSTVVCSDNTFKDQTSVSSFPLAVSSVNNTFTAHIQNNIFDNNVTGSIQLSLQDVVDANIIALNNAMTNNGTGFQARLGSSVVIIPNGTTEHCSILLEENAFANNESNALYLHTSGEITNLEITASTNTISDIGGSALVLATSVNNLTLLATENIITRINDNGIAVIGSSSTSNGNITISTNTITDAANQSNGIAINQDFSTLNLNLLDNKIDRCEGTGILSYAPNGIDSLILNISGNRINNCENSSSNAASGLDIEQYANLVGSIVNNKLLDNTGVSAVVAARLDLPNPTVCLTLMGNESTDYLLINPDGGFFNLSPCDVESINIGTINTSGTITIVQSCPDAIPCSP